MIVYITEFFIIFTVLSIFVYLLPTAAFHWWYHRRKGATDIPKIQSKIPTKKDIKREVTLSIKTIFIFTAMSFGLLQLVKGGHSAMYDDFNEFGWAYAILSFFLCLIIHDTYFYWTHRLMHWRPLFKYTHLGHHKSRTPSAWAALAFQPGEAVLQYLIFVILVLLLPLHPYVFTFYVVYDVLTNIAGHNGVELVPPSFTKLPVLKLGNTVEHHDYHHIDVTKNFGSFFNVWDRIMNTFSEGYSKEKSTK